MIDHNVSLKSYNTFGIDVAAASLATIKQPTELSELLLDPNWQNQPRLVLGGGSNILLTQNFAGLVIKNAIHGITKTKEDARHVWLRIGAGENWHSFVKYCLQHEYAGVENLSLIPGTVGAAPMQNIGAYGVELKEVFDHLEAINVCDGKTYIFDNAKCHFGYRTSIFKTTYKNQFIITYVTLRLNKNPQPNISYRALQQSLAEANIQQPSITDISKTVIKIRQQKLPDPAKLGNAGSFFKNPLIKQAQLDELQQNYPDVPFYPNGDNHYKVPAAWLIEQCGWKGKRQGNVGVHEHQALVLVNYGGGTGAELKALAQEIQQTVVDKFAIALQPEVNII